MVNHKATAAIIVPTIPQTMPIISLVLKAAELVDDVDGADVSNHVNIVTGDLQYLSPQLWLR